MIEKTAKKENNFLKELYYFSSAREAFKVLLINYKENGYTILLPAYIGFSANEGSGIFDPIKDVGIDYCFYDIDKQLNICTDKLNKIIEERQNKKLVLLLVHYFGFVDKSINKIIELCENNNITIIEDAAHALYTDFIDYNCGMYGDYVIYSLHKMLPFENGGMLKINNNLFNVTGSKTTNNRPFDYDLHNIANKRKENAREWKKLLKGNKKIELLDRDYEKFTPQTIPVIVNNFDRNDLYFKMNDAGFGLVSLYHTMISEINNKDFPNSVWLSKHITNLPVHQDVDIKDIDEMYKKLIEVINN